MLIVAGADVNQPAQDHDLVDEFPAYTPLINASRRGDEAIMKMLLKAGATVDAVDGWGMTALMNACEYGPVEIIQLLLDAGADMAHISRFGMSALHAVCIAHSKDAATLVDIIIAEGADVDAVDIFGRTALYLAASLGDVAVVQKLLAAGTNVNHGDASPLTAAGRRGHTEIFLPLLAAGADVNHRDPNGKTPLMESYDPVTVRLLVDANADNHEFADVIKLCEMPMLND